MMGTLCHVQGHPWSHTTGQCSTASADHVIKLHLQFDTDHFFQNDEFLHWCSVCGGQEGQEGQNSSDPRFTVSEVMSKIRSIYYFRIVYVVDNSILYIQSENEIKNQNENYVI